MSRIPSPARSQSAAPQTSPGSEKPHRTRSVDSPVLPNPTRRLSSMIQEYRERNRGSFVLSPLPRRSILTDNTDIEEPRCRTWWDKLEENSQDAAEMLEDNKAEEANNIHEEMDIEIISQEQKDYTLDIPESSDSESIHSIVIPQRRLFTEKENVAQKNFEQFGTRDTLNRLHKTNATGDNIPSAMTKELFRNKPRSKPFSAALLNISPNKTTGDKTLTVEVKGQTRNIFGKRQGTKRKYMFANFVVSESEDEIPDIQPEIFEFPKKSDPKLSMSSRCIRDPSPSSSITTDMELDNWRLLPSSTMVENQLEAMMASQTPKKAKLSKLSEAKESETGTSSTETASRKDKSADTNISASTRSKSNKVIEDEDKQLDKNEDNLNKSHLTSLRNNISQTSIMTRSKNKSIAVNKTTNDLAEVEKGKSVSQEFEKISQIEDNDNELNENENIVDQDEEMNENNQSKESVIQTEEHENSRSQNQSLEIEQEDVENHVENQAQNLSREIKLDNELNGSQEVLSKSKEEINEIQDEQNENRKKNESENGQNRSQEIQSKSMEKLTESQKELNENQDEQNRSQQIHSKSKEQLNESHEVQNKSQKVINESERQEEDSEAEDEIENVSQEVENGSKDEEQNIGQVEAEQIESEDEQQTISQEKNEQNESEDEQQNISQEKNEQNESEHEQQNISQEEIEENENEDEQQNISQVEAEQNESEDEQQNISQEENEQNESEDEQQNISLAETEQNETEDEQPNISQAESEQNESEDEQQNISQEETEENESEDEQQNISQEETEENESEDEQKNISQEETEQNESEDEQQNISQAETEQEVDDQEMECDEENESGGEEAIESDQNEPNHHQSTEEIDIEIPNVSHDTTGRSRNKYKSPEAVLRDSKNQADSYIDRGQSTSIRKTKSMAKNMNIRHSLEPVRESIGLDGTKSSSDEGSGWDSHRTTRKTLRQTFGKDFTPRKSLRAMVMEKSAKKTLPNDINSTALTGKFPLANSTELPGHDDYEMTSDLQESDHEVSGQMTLEMCLQMIQKKNMERRLKIEEAVKNSLKAPSRDALNPFKVPAKPTFPRRNIIKTTKPSAKAKKTFIPLECLPEEVIEDMKYKPPKRFQPSNAAWITKRLYKYLETKLEPKYDYKARVRSEKLVETLYQFAKDVRRRSSASADSINVLKQEMARLKVVQTHFDFYEFFHEFMPREIRIKVVPDAANNIPVPRHGVFSDILNNTHRVE